MPDRPPLPDRPRLPVVRCLLVTAAGADVELLLAPDRAEAAAVLQAARVVTLRVAADVRAVLDLDRQLRRWRPTNPTLTGLVQHLDTGAAAVTLYGPALLLGPPGTDVPDRVRRVLTHVQAQRAARRAVERAARRREDRR